MNITNINTAQGHWILAKMGKRVLRPGGKELTRQLINALEIQPSDDIVEFAPGIGFTAKLALAAHPKSYIGIDEDEDAIIDLRNNISGANITFELANAANSGLNSNSKDKIIGEAMLTMHADHRKAAIICESYRILKKGGIYAIHELGLREVDSVLKDTIQKDLSLAIKVNARPLTEEEWCTLLCKEGFIIKKVFSNEMHLLEPKRILDDEGWWRSLKIAFNILINPAARKRISYMSKTFKKHAAHINSIAILAEKI